MLNFLQQVIKVIKRSDKYTPYRLPPVLNQLGNKTKREKRKQKEGQNITFVVDQIENIAQTCRYMGFLIIIVELDKLSHPFSLEKLELPCKTSPILLLNSSFCGKFIPPKIVPAKGIDLCMDSFFLKTSQSDQVTGNLSKRRREDWIVLYGRKHQKQKRIPATPYLTYTFFKN